MAKSIWTPPCNQPANNYPSRLIIVAFVIFRVYFQHLASTYSECNILHLIPMTTADLFPETTSSHISIVTQSISVGSKASKHVSVNSLPSSQILQQPHLISLERKRLSFLFCRKCVTAEFMTGVSLNVHQLLVLVKLSEEYSNSQVPLFQTFKCNLKLFILVTAPLVVSFRPIFSYDDVLVDINQIFLLPQVKNEIQLY